MGAVDAGTWALRLAVGLLSGAVGLYALYKLTTLNQQQEEQMGRGSGDRQIEKQNLVHRVSGLKVAGDNRGIADTQQGLVLAKSPDGLEKQHLQMVLGLLQGSSDSCTRELTLVTVGNSAAFTSNQDLIRSLGGLSVVANCLSDEVASVKVKAMNALNNLSMNVANQEELKIWIPQILEIIEATTLNSELQVAGLRVLTNISVTNNYHHMMTNSIPHFLKLLVEGTESIKVQVLKVLVNLSANPGLTHDLLYAQAPLSFLLLFDSRVNKEVLLRLLIFVANLKENLNLLQGSVQYEVESLHSVLFGNPTPFSHKLAMLMLYQDNEVKQQVARIISD
ncbi:armadillo repeat-containing protein 10 isoform X2 [Carcharodon carcharias]|uniref:armadillo repeat-containing protein 10 isoform X2 n=1 Tax=Carcharodon carcharias TaxID=13397 RepID=UPI001B7ECDC2|nr:armadillo repeat-containing protein 10 isoform X2 [Carcharodon carcharias]